MKFVFNVVKPSFEQAGADLVILKDIGTKKTKFLNVQSKGRTVGEKATNIKIPKEYAIDRFALFVYAVDQEKNESPFFFFQDEIKD